MSDGFAASVNGQRLWQSLMDLAKIGATPKGGNCRLALTELDGQARDLVVQWMKDADLTVTVDKVGNIFGRRQGRNPNLAPVATGSHIDTQPTGGKFDGCYGVMAGLEVMRTLQENNITTEAPLELIIWTNEEGTRFVPVMMGSGVFSEVFTLDTALGAKDKQGKTVREELVNIGYAGTEPIPSHSLGSYIEAHIEQGPILEAEEKIIGVVTGSLSLRWFDLIITGMEAHAGPTPMSMRRDSLYAASFIIQDVIDIANKYGPEGRGTIGEIQAHPSSRNVIPGQIRMTIDLRHEDGEILDLMEAQFRQACESLSKGDRTGYKVDVEIKEIQQFPATPFAPALVDAVQSSAEKRNYSHRRIVTGAGHDAVYIATVAPTAMIFVPCKDGISHNELEDAKPEHLEAGANVLLDAMLEKAKQ